MVSTAGDSWLAVFCIVYKSGCSLHCSGLQTIEMSSSLSRLGDKTGLGRCFFWETFQAANRIGGTELKYYFYFLISSCMH